MPNSGTEAGVGGPAVGGAWNLRDTGGFVPSAAAARDRQQHHFPE